MPTVISMGEAVVDLFAIPDGVCLEEAKSFSLQPGGAPANVAVALARLGVNVGFVGTVGDDPFGGLLTKQLLLEGVDTTHFRQVADSPTMVSFVAATSPHDQDFVIYRGADEKLAVKDLNRPYFETAEVFIYSSVALSGSGREANREAVRWVNEAGGLVAYDANLRPAVWRNLEEARQGILAGLAGVSLVKLNESELQLLAETDDLKVGSRWVLDQGVKLCLVTLGSGGAYYNNGRSAAHVPGFQVESVDATGCGDAFLSGLVSGLLNTSAALETLDDQTLTSLVRFANAAGALTATCQGAIAALPTLARVNAFLSEHVN